MGGNALKHLNVRRLPRQEYEVLTQEVIRRLEDFRCAPVPAYKDKASFGDLDLIVSSDASPPPLREVVQQRFQPREIISNGDCLSFDFQNFQVDLIRTCPSLFDITLFYYSYNDLNNLVGKIAHRMGLKFGHRGLYLPVTLNTTHWEDIVLSTEPEKIYKFLQYDFEVYQRGFSTLPDIFRYVASSPYFNTALFLSENQNHKHRLRNRKRDTYRQFLTWLEESPLTFKMHDWEEDGTNYTAKALDFFGKTQQWHDVMIKINRHQEIHDKFNGHWVAQWTNLRGKALGDLMQRIKQHWKTPEQMEDWILVHSAEEIRQFVLEQSRT